MMEIDEERQSIETNNHKIAGLRNQTICSITGDATFFSLPRRSRLARRKMAWAEPSGCITRSLSTRGSLESLSRKEAGVYETREVMLTDLRAIATKPKFTFSKRNL